MSMRLVPRQDRRWSATAAGVLVLAFVLFLVALNLFGEEYSSPGALGLVLTGLQILPLVLALRRPLLALVLWTGGQLLVALVAEPLTDRTPWPVPVPGLLAYLVVLVLLAAARPARDAVIAWCSSLVWLAVVQGVADGPSSQSPAMVPALSAGALLVGGILRSRGEVQDRLREVERTTELERERSRLLEERTRIARELHDVVAHHMSIITVQAESAPYRLGEVTPEVSEEFRGIAESARGSLVEMRRLLEVLRHPGDAAERAPQPSIRRLPELVEGARTAGVPVLLRVPPSGPDEGLEEAVELTAYRIVQEALSNVVRHAPGAETVVEVQRQVGVLVVSVVNGPAPGTTSAVTEPVHDGHGLIGMRERVVLLAGTLELGPRADGGFLVRATLPTPRSGPGP